MAGDTAALGESVDTRREIRCIAGELPRIVDEAEGVLIDLGERVYQRGAMLVRPTRRPASSIRKLQRVAGALGLAQVDVANLVETLTRVARFVRWDGRSEAWRAINCPEKVAVTLLSRVGQWRLPRLWAALNAPTLRPDGSVLQEPGYDDPTAMLLDFDAGMFSDFRVSDAPSRTQAERALEHLLAAVGSFPFVAEVDRAAAVSLLLTATVRRSLPSAPLGAITATVMASGKTLLADVISIIANGASAPVMTHPSSDEEAGKLLLSVLAEGEPVVLIDNVERPLQGDWLCAALTSESYSGRLLGRNTMAQVPTSTLFLATGNALVLAGDLRTRALLIRLDPRCEHPEQREFAGDLRDQILQKRPLLVQAALTIMRAFVVSGARASDHVRPWGRFERWSDLVRAPLVWLGLQDPCASLAFLEADDPDRTRHSAMLRAWRDEFGAEAISMREVIDLSLRDSAKPLHGALNEVARDRSGQIDALRLGKWMHKHQGRIVDGLEFERAGERRGAALWRVVAAK